MGERGKRAFKIGRPAKGAGGNMGLAELLRVQRRRVPGGCNRPAMVKRLWGCPTKPGVRAEKRNPNAAGLRSKCRRVK